ncbi:MAG: hypothetical protein JSS96_14765 [Bacteroidetes bacterium]|nr:hypothetical protein [Bacteroidota bacterium]
MRQGSNQSWLHYIKDIIAADVYSAVFLATYVRTAERNKSYFPNLEVVDLTTHQIIKQTPGVQLALSNSELDPYMFVIGKN